MAAVTSTSASMAATAVFLHRLPPGKPVALFRPLPRRPNFKAASAESRRAAVKASSSDESAPLDANELLTDLKEKWDGVENKPTVVLYGGGAIAAVWLASALVGAINSVPLLPKILELVGLGYTGWFVYRYLLFKSSRKELAEDIEALKKKIAGFE